ncbi:TPA: hypothetical protein MNK97_005276 [Klebsiella pneumoniae]|nr:hypothetical protein [Klebsiella pneumoniae]
MQTVSFQGVQLSATQRLRADQQSRLRLSMSGGLAQLTESIDKAMAEHKRTAAEPFKPERQWFLESNEHGTPWLGDVFGF